MQRYSGKVKKAGRVDIGQPGETCLVGDIEQSGGGEVWLSARPARTVPGSTVALTIPRARWTVTGYSPAESGIMQGEPIAGTFRDAYGKPLPFRLTWTEGGGYRLELGNC